MKAEIIAVGNEIVTGNTVNTNAAYIAKALQTIGIVPYYHSAIRDDNGAIEEALDTALKRVQVIIVTGGLGPTKDDLTKETICQHLNQTLEMREEVLNEIEVYFEKRKLPMVESNKKQAAFPKNAYLLKNNNGTAPGCILQHEGAYIVLLPGPPKEMQPMMDEGVLPYFKKQFKHYSHTIDIKTFGIGESVLAEKINDLLGDFENYNVAPYVGKNEIIVRITSEGNSQEEAVDKAEDVKKQVVKCLEEYVIGYNEDTLEENVLELLKKHHYTVATVESCTGGLLAATLINCSGISEYFNEGVVTYSNKAKEHYVGVLGETLKRYGAVSPQTAKEMAEGIKAKSGATIGLSTTGIAGPGGGTKEKPVGLVYVGLAIGNETFVYELNLSGKRQDIREKTVKQILVYLYKHLS